jgi:hypothetical protein
MNAASMTWPLTAQVSDEVWLVGWPTTRVKKGKDMARKANNQWC